MNEKTHKSVFEGWLDSAQDKSLSHLSNRGEVDREKQETVDGEVEHITYSTTIQNSEKSVTLTFDSETESLLNFRLELPDMKKNFSPHVGELVDDEGYLVVARNKLSFPFKLDHRLNVHR